MMAEPAAGLIVELAGALHFIPARVAQRVVPSTIVTPVPGTDLGMALIAGRVLAVIAVGEPRAQFVVCRLGDEEFAISGMTVLSAGLYEPAGQGVRYADQVIALFDTASHLQRLPAAARPDPERPGESE